MFKFIFELVTDPLGLPIEWYWELLILYVIGEIAYRTAFSEVRSMYNSDMISGYTLGSFFHWLIRTGVFVAMWAVAYALIWIVRFVMTNYDIIIAVLVSLVMTYILAMLIEKIIIFIFSCLYGFIKKEAVL